MDYISVESKGYNNKDTLYDPDSANYNIVNITDGF